MQQQFSHLLHSYSKSILRVLRKFKKVQLSIIEELNYDKKKPPSDIKQDGWLCEVTE